MQTIPFSEAQFAIKNEIRNELWNKQVGKLYMVLLETAILGDLETFVKETCLAAYDTLKIND